MIPIVSYAYTVSCELLPKQLLLYGTSNNPNVFIDLTTNDLSSTLRNKNKSLLYVGQQCKKYHFQCYIEAVVNNKTLSISNIKLNRIHFVKQVGSTHFVVSSHYDVSTTSVVITTNAEMREVILPVFDFDFSKKLLIQKLNTIELLG